MGTEGLCMVHYLGGSMAPGRSLSTSACKSPSLCIANVINIVAVTVRFLILLLFPVKMFLSQFETAEKHLLC